MIIGNDRKAVIENIHKAVDNKDFYKKVEIGDPVLTKTEEKEITDNYLKTRSKILFKLKSGIACFITNSFSKIFNKNLEICGDFDKSALENGAIITSNHFSPTENTIIRYFVLKNGKKRLGIVSQVTNFAMKGFIGFLMNYAETIPLSSDFRYLTGDFIEILKQKLTKGEPILIYPEQEMWFNYKKPRPLKRGAYHFAAKLNVPIISCFVEMKNLTEKENKDFFKVGYKLHILGTLYPDKTKTVKENSERLCAQDYELKKQAYERIYHKPLEYDFSYTDIAGYIGDTDE